MVAGDDDATATVTRPAAPGAKVTTIAVGEKVRALTQLALLPHCMGKTVADAVPLARMTDLDPTDLHDPLQDAFKDALKAAEDAWIEEQKVLRAAEEKKQKKKLPWKVTKKEWFGTDDIAKVVPIALVDLTEDPKLPKLAGFNLTTSRHPASTSKLACMFAAYQLQFDLQVLATTSGVTTQAELFELARYNWGLTQAPVAGAARQPLRSKGTPTIEQLDKLIYLGGKPVTAPKPTPAALKNKNRTKTTWDFLAPNLERIFAPPRNDTDPLTAFRSTGEGFPDLFQFEYPTQFPGYAGKLTSRDKAKRAALLKDLGFKERLDLMLGQSHNGATGSCVHDVGYLYINSALLQAGFYDPDQGGLWMGASYGGTSFVNDPVSNRNLSTTPIAFARLMTRFARTELVSEAASKAMRPPLHKAEAAEDDWKLVGKEWIRINAEKYMTADPGMGSRSPFKPGVVKLPASGARVFSKLGLLGGELNVSDVAWILRKPPPVVAKDGSNVDQKMSSFVLVALSSSDAAMQVIAEAATRAVEAINRREA